MGFLWILRFLDPLLKGRNLIVRHDSVPDSAWFQFKVFMILDTWYIRCDLVDLTILSIHTHHMGFSGCSSYLPFLLTIWDSLKWCSRLVLPVAPWCAGTPWCFPSTWTWMTLIVWTYLLICRIYVIPDYLVLPGAPWCSLVLPGALGCSLVLPGAPWRSLVDNYHTIWHATCRICKIVYYDTYHNIWDLS